MPAVEHDWLRYLPISAFYCGTYAHTFTINAVSLPSAAAAVTAANDASQSALVSLAKDCSATLLTASITLDGITAQSDVEVLDNTAEDIQRRTRDRLSASIRRSILKPIVDRAQNHVWGHADFDDLSVLQECNDLWTAEANKYLLRVTESGKEFRPTIKPISSHKGSLSSLSPMYNNVTCVDHMFLDQTRVFPVLNAKTGTPLVVWSKRF